YERHGVRIYSIGYKRPNGTWAFRLSCHISDQEEIAALREEAIHRATGDQRDCLHSQTFSAVAKHWLNWQKTLPPDSAEKRADSTLTENEREVAQLIRAFGRRRVTALTKVDAYTYLRDAQSKGRSAKGNKEIALAILAGGVLAAVIGVLVGGLALRMRDIYLALVTFAFGEVMQWVFLNWTGVTGGASGLRMTPANLFGYEIATDKQAYFFVLVLAAVFVVLTFHISRSRLGSAFRAVRESEVAAMAMGVNVRRMKVAAFGISAFYAGCAGGIFTLFSSFIHPDSLGFQTTVLILIMVVVGGMGSVSGATGGVIVFGLLSEGLRQVLSGQEIIFGIVLMLFMMYAPRGLFDAIAMRRQKGGR